MQNEKVNTYFRNVHKASNSASTSWSSFDCPFCDSDRHKKKAAVNILSHKVKCWECGYNDFIDNFIGTVEGYTKNQVTAYIKTFDETDLLEASNNALVTYRMPTAKVTLPHGYKSLLYGQDDLGKKARDYLQGRGFNLDALDAYGFGYCDHHADKNYDDFYGYIIVPFKSMGRLVWYQGRDYIGNKLRYKNPPTQKYGVGKNDCLFNEDALLIYDTVFVTEGWSDSITIGDNAVSTQGWSLSFRQKALISKSQASLVIVPDLGIATDGVSYYKKAMQLAMDYVDYKKVKVLDLSLIAKDGDKDANNIGRDLVLELESKTDFLTQTDIILSLI